MMTAAVTPFGLPGMVVAAQVNPAGLVLLAAAGLLAVQLGRLVLRWRRGGPAKVDWLRGIIGLPAAYLGPVHHVVGRDPASARMHMLAAGGLLAALVLSLPLHLWGQAPRLLAVPVLGFCLVALAGAVLARRRHGHRVPAGHSLSSGSFARLPLAIAGAVLFLLLAALLRLTGAGSALLWLPVAALGALALGWLAWQAHGGPMRHVLAGALHLVAHPRPARTVGRRDSVLRTPDLDNPALPLGIGTTADLPWNRLLAHDACVQCGRCEAVCPAFAAGQPLNPKALINDLVRAAGPGVGAPYAGQPHPGMAQAGTEPVSHLPLVAGPDGFAVIAPGTLWSCTTCRACVEECPMLIEHVDTVIDLRRHATMELGAVPPRAAEVLNELTWTDTQSGRAPADRGNWALGLNLREIGSTGRAEVLLWQGEAAFQAQGQKVLRHLLSLMRLAGVDVAVLGEEEADCGEIARRLGDEAGFQRLARANVAALNRYQFQRIVTTDPHALQMLAREYPAFGGTWVVEHHSQFLERLFAEGRLQLPVGEAPRQGRITWHDPCYLGRHGGETLAPRKLLDRLGIDRVEMARHGLSAMCCGGGGGAPLADVPGRTRIPDLRIEQARQTGAETVAVGCPGCMAMLDGVPGPRPQVVDIAELTARRMGVAA